MVLPSTMSAFLDLLWIRNRNTNVLGVKTRMLLNAVASLIWQHFFLLFIPAKTNAVVTESLPGATLPGCDFAKTEIWEEIFYLQAVHTDMASHGTPCAKSFYRLKLHCCQIAFVRSTRNVFWSPKCLCAWDHKAVSLLNLQSHIFIYIYMCVCVNNWFPLCSTYPLSSCI